MVMDVRRLGALNGGPTPCIAGFFGWTVWKREMGNAKNGIKTAEQACKDAATEIQAWIDEKLAG